MHTNVIACIRQESDFGQLSGRFISPCVTPALLQSNRVDIEVRCAAQGNFEMFEMLTAIDPRVE